MAQEEKQKKIKHAPLAREEGLHVDIKLPKSLKRTKGGSAEPVGDFWDGS